jgi:putative addiction module CopG family antidote
LVISKLKLPAALEKFVTAQVEQGAYRSRQAVIVAAVANAKRHTQQRAARAQQIQKGLDSGTAGPLDMENVIRGGRGRTAARKRRLPV